jgi:hypothetical protein
MPNRREMLNELVKRARSDSTFFHQLVFNPEEVLGKLDFLPRREKGMILSLTPEDVIAGLAGLLVNPDLTPAFCGDSCNESCTSTCGGSCGSTCGSSCGGTCGAASCGDTTKFVDPPHRGMETGPVRTAYGGGRWFFRPVQRSATE